MFLLQLMDCILEKVNETNILTKKNAPKVVNTKYKFIDKNSTWV